MNLLGKTELLQEYALLRIIHYEYIIRAIEEDSNAYESQISDIGVKIERILFHSKISIKGTKMHVNE